MELQLGYRMRSCHSVRDDTIRIEYNILLVSVSNEFVCPTN